MHSTWRFQGLVVALAALSGACSVYDDALVASAPVAQVLDRAGQSAAGFPAEVGGYAAAAGAGGGPTAGDATQGGGGSGAQQDSCGNAQLDGDESCDIAIKAGLPGACPGACPSKDPCVRARLEGSGCQARCVFSAPSCADADGCCPADCSTANDSDCSAACGDGVVQAERGETCEIKPGIAVELACASEQSCQSDSACMRATLLGSRSNCNLRCVKEPVTNAQSDDGCCPPGGNANVDSDCPPKCGNGVREAAEECDMSAGCGSDCKLLPKSAVDVCLASLAADGGACERCECEHCGGEVSACVASGQAQRDARCLAVEQCATDNDCAGNTCYCGSALLLCALEPLGACVPQIEQAAGTHSWITIQAQFLDSGSALGRAQTLGECRRDHCSNVCP